MKIALSKLPLPDAGEPIIAYGAEKNSGFCLAKGGRAELFVLGEDLTDPSARENFTVLIRSQCEKAGISPSYAAHDMHPDYVSSRLAAESGLVTIAVQHHHAHFASVLAESGFGGAVIGVIFDGMGMGPDGELWGGEFLTGDLDSFKRAGHIKPAAQPGGDAAAVEPWRMALSYIRQAFGDNWERAAGSIIARQGADRCEVVVKAAEKGINSPPTSSAGRLFEAVSSMLGLCDVNESPAQAAVMLEKAAAGKENSPMNLNIYKEEGAWIADPAPVIRGIVSEMESGKNVALIAANFHRSVADMAVTICRSIRDETGINHLVLSGGVFQNNILGTECLEGLKASNFEIIKPREVPVNDGGISYGQAAVAARRICKEKS